MNGFVGFTGLANDQKVYIKADRIVLVTLCEDILSGEYTRIEYDGGQGEAKVKEKPEVVFSMMEDALVE